MLRSPRSCEFGTHKSHTISIRNPDWSCWEVFSIWVTTPMPFPFAKYFENLWLKSFLRTGYFYLLLFYRHVPCQGKSSSIKCITGIAIYVLTPTNYSSMQQPGKARNQAEKKQGGEGLFGSSLLCIIHSSHNAVSPGYCPTNTHKFYSVTKNTNKHKWIQTKLNSLGGSPGLPKWTFYLHFSLYGLIFPPAQTEILRSSLCCFFFPIFFRR